MTSHTILKIALSDGCINTVSYTHLDVYKRQPHDGAFGYFELLGEFSRRRFVLPQKHRQNAQEPIRLHSLYSFFGNYTIMAAFLQSENKFSPRGAIFVAFFPRVCYNL